MARKGDPKDQKALEDQDELSALREQIEEFGIAEGRVHIYRFSGTRDKEYVSTWDISEWGLEEVREAYGGGRYQFRFADATGKYRFGKNVRIAGAEKPLFEEPEEAATPPAGALDEKWMMLQMLANMRDDIRSVARELRAPPDPEFSRQNPIDLATSLAGAISSMMAPYMKAMENQAKGDSDRSGADPLDQAIRIVELIQATGGVGGGGGNRSALLERLAGPVLERIAESDRLGGDAAPAPGGAIAPPAPASPVDPSRLPPEGPPPWLRMLLPFLPDMVVWASEDRDPALRAGLIMEEVPGGLYPAVAGAIGAETMVDQLVHYVPALLPYRQWCEDFRAAALDYLGPDGDDGGAALEGVEVGTVPDKGRAPEEGGA